MSNVLDMVPEHWGPKAKVTGGAVTLTTRGPGSIQFQAPADLALILFTPQSNRVTALASDKPRQFTAPAGSIEIIPADADFYGRWSTPQQNILLGLEPGKITQIAESEFESDRLAFHPPASATVDRKALQIADLLRDEPQHLLPSSLTTRSEDQKARHAGTRLSLINEKQTSP
ncbi:hypothetical protein [Agrobacterium sp. LMR679]|uniref:hypothetical protein n=1 Tax=Agrobacterium sp. LMR679 TaxID=3014335 RepID=UPI0022AFB9BC|nr:hypothetical protein [Agrobacterium sp. LMR679]MCZ4072081.1 hypothetical protein [Agrobacterium sp. LMR679]